MERSGRQIEFTNHARQRMRERGANEDAVLNAILIGEREPVRHGHVLYRLNLEFNRTWDDRYYRIQQVAPVVAEEEDRLVVITVYVFYFQEVRP